jgi:glycosyltransferase involved in cell wall biosynthesis
VTLLSAREAEALRRDVHWSGANGVVVPNGVPESPVEPLPAWQDRDPRILVVGRIEPGKRSTDILETAERLGVPVTFVGACNPAAREYGERFASAVRDAQHATWLGARERTEVLDLMAHSRVLLNFSWVEVQSLVDIEAAMQGCWVVACSNGSSAEHLGGHVVELPEDRIVDAVRAAAARARSDAGPGTPSYGATWRGAARALLDVYSGPT